MNKKSVMFEGLIFLVLVILMITAFAMLSKKNSQFDEYQMGQRQYSLAKTYQKAEYALFYVDQSSKYALDKTVRDFSNNGGISEIEITEGTEASFDYECGKYKGANVWFKIEKGKDGYVDTSCFDEKLLDDNFAHEFNKNLNEYLSLSPYKILINNYNFEFKDNLIIGNAIYPLELNIYNKENDEEIIIRDQEKDPSSISKNTHTIDGLVDFSDSVVCSKQSKCQLEEEAFLLVIKAQEAAIEKDVSLQVTSSYRSEQEQIDIWEGNTLDRWAQRIPDEGKRREKVCYPYGEGIEKRCSHLTGNAVDIRFKGKTIKTMTSQDWNLLHQIMTESGWIRYSNEPWHFECCGTDRYARAKEKGVTEIV